MFHDRESPNPHVIFLRAARTFVVRGSATSAAIRHEIFARCR